MRVGGKDGRWVVRMFCVVSYAERDFRVERNFVMCRKKGRMLWLGCRAWDVGKGLTICRDNWNSEHLRVEAKSIVVNFW